MALTLEALPADLLAEPAITWREISKGLWVGRARDRHAGVVERGHRYSFTDPDGMVQGGFLSLAAAQHAAAVRSAVLDSGTGNLDLAVDAGQRRPPLLLAFSSGFVGAGAVVLCGFALAMLR